MKSPPWRLEGAFQGFEGSNEKKPWSKVMQVVGMYMIVSM